MSQYYLCLKLISNTTFGRGDGVAGLIDAEVEHDDLGLPFLRGRALKGLLVEECANILYSLERQEESGQLTKQALKDWCDAADNLFGKPGSGLSDDAKMYISDAALPQELRSAVRYAIANKELKREDILSSLTAIRRQTAMSPNGAPQPESLRSMRVVLRETEFEAALSFTSDLDEQELVLLAACAAGLRHIGLGRNRGRGRVEVRLFHDADITAECLKSFGAMLTVQEAAQ